MSSLALILFCLLSCRKLLCGEEARLSTGSDTHMSLPYIYHQSPVYTLPSLGRPGGPRRRAEPQYKFVEEIITETTREIELSEFEEREPEETELGIDEQEHDKRDGGGGEEEDDNKDSGEEEGEQVCDNQPNEVESLEPAVNESDAGDNEKDETDKIETDDSEDNGDNNTKSKVLLSLDKKEDEQLEKVDDNTEEEEEATVMKVIVEEDLPAKSDDLKPDVVEEDKHPEISVNAKKADPFLKDHFIPAIKKPVDESQAEASEESEKVKELSSAVHDKVHASENVENITDFTSEAESKEEAHVTSTAAKSEETEHDDTQAGASSNSEAAQGDEKVAIHIQDARDESNKSPPKEISPKSHEEYVSEVEEKTSGSASKTEADQTVLPKEKTSDRAEVKQLHQGTEESSQAQKPELSDSSEKTEK